MTQFIVALLTLLCASCISGIGPKLSLAASPLMQAESAAPMAPARAPQGVAAAPSTGSDTISSTASPAVAAEPAVEPAVAMVLARLEGRHTRLSRRDSITLAETIVEQAERYELDPGLVLAVIEVESGFYNLAVSHVGALGLMQLMPATGQELARKHGVPWSSEESLFDPIVNVKLGTAYLKQLSDKYDGDVQVALAAYNWGPGRIDRFLRRGSPLPSEYIQRVMRSYTPSRAS